LNESDVLKEKKLKLPSHYIPEVDTDEDLELDRFLEETSKYSLSEITEEMEDQFERYTEKSIKRIDRSGTFFFIFISNSYIADYEEHFIPSSDSEYEHDEEESVKEESDEEEFEEEESDKEESKEEQFEKKEESEEEESEKEEFEKEKFEKEEKSEKEDVEQPQAKKKKVE
jgi:hypothetical protein